MKDILSVLKDDTFSILITFLLPGGLFIFSYYKLLLNTACVNLQPLLPDTDIERAFILLAVSFTAGFVIQDLASWIEVLFDTTEENKKESYEVWYQYLRTAFPVEPVGQSYIRTIVLRFRFELNIAVATFLSLPAIVSLLGPVIPLAYGSYVVSGTGVTFCVYLLFEAYTSHTVLHKQRRNLVGLPAETKSDRQPKPITLAPPPAGLAEHAPGEELN